jgi:hypothetical protein
VAIIHWKLQRKCQSSSQGRFSQIYSYKSAIKYTKFVCFPAYQPSICIVTHWKPIIENYFIVEKIILNFSFWRSFGSNTKRLYNNRTYYPGTYLAECAINGPFPVVKWQGTMGTWEKLWGNIRQIPVSKPLARVADSTQLSVKFKCLNNPAQPVLDM